MARLRVKEIAAARGFDIAKLSRRTDLGYTTVYAIWNNQTRNPGIQTLEAIARVLDVKITDLIEEEPETQQRT